MSIIRSQSIKNPRTQVDRAQIHPSFSSYFTYRQNIVKSFHTPELETSLPFLCVHTGTWLKTARAPRIHYAKIGLYKKSLVRSQIYLNFSVCLVESLKGAAYFSFETNKGWRQKFPT